LDRCADTISTPLLKSAVCVRNAKKSRAHPVFRERKITRRPPARQLQPWLDSFPPAWPQWERTARQRSASRRCARASNQLKLGWCGDCMCRPPRLTGHSEHGLSRSQRHDSRAAWGRQHAPNESSPRRYKSFQIPVLCCGLFGSLAASAQRRSACFHPDFTRGAPGSRWTVLPRGVRHNT
jgi:hypothetical protein